MDEKDLLLLKLLRDNPYISLKEMQAAILCRSVATVFNRLSKLEAQGLISAPPVRKQSRSRRITEKGKLLLRENGM